MIVYLLTTGDGSDGDEWQVQGVYTTSELAEEAKLVYERVRHRPNGSTYFNPAQIEQWETDVPMGIPVRQGE